MQPAIHFWFSIGSTHTYLSVMRMTELAQRAGVAVEWKPFSIRALLSRNPFTTNPPKERYMWRDIERRALNRGLAPRLPAVYPLEHFDRANRVAVIGRQQGWCDTYTVAAYRHWFHEGTPAGTRENIVAALKDIDIEPEAVLREAESTEVEAAYRDATSEAKALGVFGVPMFLVGEEMFWGDDRLEDALSWAKDRATEGSG